MAVNLTHSLLFTVTPVSAAVIGGIVAAYWPPTPKVRSFIQHFAAGVVFAALSVEVLPDVMHHRAPLAAAGGFAVGTALMLLIRWLTRRSNEGKQDQRGFSWSYVLAIAVDVLIDGVLLGIGFVAGQQTGKVLAVALTAELLSLGLATAADLITKGNGRTRSILTTTSLGLLTLAGVLAGVLLLGGLSPGWLEAMLAFAAAALLYLVTEELLVEAHEVPETPLTTAMFFAGFLGLLMLEMIS